jgi:GNAT superfamily N-acetyltransferase
MNAAPAAMLRYSLHDGPLPAADTAVVDTGIGDFNAAAAPLQEVQPLACFARDDAGTVWGGAVGRTWGRCCELQQLWVHAAQRRRGVGAVLLQRFEQQAGARGCRLVYLETFSFQAPGFYAAQGYRTVLTIEGFGPGLAKLVMQRELP